VPETTGRLRGEDAWGVHWATATMSVGSVPCAAADGPEQLTGSLGQQSSVHPGAAGALQSQPGRASGWGRGRGSPGRDGVLPQVGVADAGIPQHVLYLHRGRAVAMACTWEGVGGHCNDRLYGPAAFQTVLPSRCCLKLPWGCWHKAVGQ